MRKYYREYRDFLEEHFPGRKMQKLTVNAGFTCPNRDGTLGRGGCIYCNNNSFSPGERGGRTPEDVARQIRSSMEFFRRKYPAMRYLAYFQSYTNTYGDLPELMALYDEALSQPGVDGVIIGTRPDCLPQELVAQLGERCRRGEWFMVELGAETIHDQTLRAVNRCHTWADTVDGFTRLKQAGIPTGLHLIMGLPGETEQMMLESVGRVAALHPDAVKFHQLQIVEGSEMGRRWKEGVRFPLFSVDEYLHLCARIVEIFNRESPQTAIERFVSSAPDSLLIAPRWGLKNYQFVNRLHKGIGDRG